MNYYFLFFFLILILLNLTVYTFRVKIFDFLKLVDKAKKLSNINLIVPHNKVARIQECHIFLGHFMLGAVEKKLIKI